MVSQAHPSPEVSSPATTPGTGAAPETGSPAVEEKGGRKGPEPTRYGDWEKNGRCIDF